MGIAVHVCPFGDVQMAGLLPSAPAEMNLSGVTVTANISLGSLAPSATPLFQAPSPADHHAAAVAVFPVTCSPTTT
jgi:hypothetical protein